jgi:hypothetical protein
MQECAEILCRGEPPLARFVAQNEDPVLGCGIEAAVPDKVEDMVLPAAQLSLKLGETGLGEALESYLTAIDEPLEGLVQPRPLALDVEAWIAGRARASAPYRPSRGAREQ